MPEYVTVCALFRVNFGLCRLHLGARVGTWNVFQHAFRAQCSGCVCELFNVHFRVLRANTI
eukprot:6725215-Lingulodinium_polyedra.AAC.1